jgi:F-type H+-transporting ATPase subunit a
MTFIASGWTIFSAIPGFDGFNEKISHMMGDSWVAGQPVHSVVHILLSMVATFVVVGLVAATRSSWSKSDNPAIPDAKFGARNIIELVLDTVIGLGTQVFGKRETAKKFLPLIGTLALYIFFSNIIGLIPGFTPPTDNLNITVGPAIVVFLATHYYGLRENGVHYLAHFLGPKIGKFPWLFPIMLPIELISHLARPLSLSLRLMGNMTGDHAVLAIFLALVPLVVPIPFLMLGTIVCTVQTLVFCLLSMVYISLAIEHSEEEH